MTGGFGDPRLPDRFWAKVEVVAEASTYPGPCWIWNKAISTAGYATYWYQDSTMSGHVVSYTCLVEKVPAGLQLDHLCRIRSCVNPDHLEPVTGRVNTLRGETLPATNAAKTHCLRGHEFTSENTRMARDGRRICRACPREARQALVGEELQAHRAYMQGASKKSRAKRLQDPEKLAKIRLQNKEASRRWRDRRRDDRALEREQRNESEG